MRGGTERVHMGCAGPGLQGGKSTWAAPSAVTEGQSGRLGRADGQRGQGWWLRASERTWAVDLHSRPMDTASEELVLGGGRSTSSTYPLLLGSWSQLLRQRGREVTAHFGNAQSKVGRNGADYLCVQEKGMGHASDEVWDGFGAVPARRVARTCCVAT